MYFGGNVIHFWGQPEQGRDWLVPPGEQVGKELTVVGNAGISTEAAPNVASEFAETVWNHHSHALDVQRGLYLQEILTSAAMGIDESH
jgi:hypothetical protein